MQDTVAEMVVVLKTAGGSNLKYWTQGMQFAFFFLPLSNPFFPFLTQMAKGNKSNRFGKFVCLPDTPNWNFFGRVNSLSMQLIRSNSRRQEMSYVQTGMHNQPHSQKSNQILSSPTHNRHPSVCPKQRKTLEENRGIKTKARILPPPTLS